MSVLVSAALGLACGCDEPVSNLKAKSSPSGAAMFPLPGDAGFVAVTTESAETLKGARGKKHLSTIVARFFQPDGTTPIDPPPTEVSVKIGVSGETPPVALAPSLGQERSPGRFASPQGDYPDGLMGTVSAKIGGQTVEVPVTAR